MAVTRPTLPAPAGGFAIDVGKLSPVDRVIASISGAASVAAGTRRSYNDTGRDLTIDSVRVSAGVAPVGSALTVDVNLNDTTIFTTQGNRPKVAAAGRTGTAKPDVTTWPAGGYLTADVDTVGSGTAGSDVTVTVTAH